MFISTPPVMADQDATTPDAMAAARADLFRQAQAACALGSPFVRDVLVAAMRQLHRAPMLALRLATWPGDRAAAALALRVNSALHLLARSGDVPSLSAAFATRTGDVDRAVADAFEAADTTLARLIAYPTQTNEVARSGALHAGLMAATARFDQPIELLELGSSAGLNLNLDRYAFCLGGTASGDPASSVRIAPRWHGPAPRRHRLRLASASGVDLAPLDVTDPECCERLMCYVWADRPDRMAQLQAAIRIARHHPPACRARGCRLLAERPARSTPRHRGNPRRGPFDAAPISRSGDPRAHPRYA